MIDTIKLLAIAYIIGNLINVILMAIGNRKYNKPIEREPYYIPITMRDSEGDIKFEYLEF
jgi:hypothetical protein